MVVIALIRGELSGMLYTTHFYGKTSSGYYWGYYMYVCIIPVKSPVFNRSLLFFGLHFTCLLFFSCFFIVSCFSPVFLENQSKTTIISCFSSSSAQIYLNSYSLACKLRSSSLPKQYSVDLIEPSLPKSCN